jgi:hypothetical protein
MIKFICKDLWHVLFRKQIDNLKTNHRGTFVLTDNKFPALARMSVDRRRGPRGVDEALRAAQPVCFSFLIKKKKQKKKKRLLIGRMIFIMTTLVFVFPLWNHQRCSIGFRSRCHGTRRNYRFTHGYLSD